MKVYEKKFIAKKSVKYYICNKCGAKINHKNKYTDFLNIKKRWGYNSKNDGKLHSFQLCEKCYNIIINDFVIKVNAKEKIIKPKKTT